MEQKGHKLYDRIIPLTILGEIVKGSIRPGNLQSMSSVNYGLIEGGRKWYIT